MKNARRTLSLVLALLMVFSLMTTAFAADTAAPAQDLKGSTVILHTNDVHGAIDGYATIAAVKKDLESRGAYVLLFDAGDFIQGETTVSESQGKTAVELMNAAGYDLAVPGNHEFDYGYDNLVALTKEAKFPVIAANVSKDGKTAFQANAVFTAPDGTKIGVFGLTTPETATKAHPAKIKGVTFAAGDKLVAVAQAQVAELEKQGCDLIVCLGHLGIDAESAGNRSIDVLKKVTGIDVFIDGHSHSTMEEVKAATDNTGKVGETLLTSTGTKFENIGMVTYDGKKIETGTVALKDFTVTPDAEIAARAEAIKAEIEKAYGKVFAISSVDLNGERNPGVRTQETNLGNLITDALLWTATKDSGLEVDAAHTVALTNGGGIRASIKAGDITKKDVNTVLPFGNTVAVVYVTGEALLEALEASTQSAPDALGGFPQVSGIEFVVNTNAAYDAGENYPGSTYASPKSIKRVTITAINGKEFDPKATYAVVTNDFTAAGGDTYYTFKTSKTIVDTGIPMDVAVMDYITTKLGGKVTAEKYGETEGRITVLSTPAAKSVQVSPQAVTYNGKEVKLDVYNIDGYNYFQLRDVAALVNESTNRFAVDAANNTINCTTGKKYEPTGNEMKPGKDNSASCVASSWLMTVNGEIVDCDIYNLGGYNYFQLRDLSAVLGFGVDFNAETNTVVITVK